MRTPNTVPMRASFQLRRPSRALCVLAAVGLASATAWGEVVSFSGKAEASITEHVAAASSRSDSASLAYPGSSLPLQVLAQLSTDASQYPSAGAVAAQFADPTTDPANPEEFAINLTLNSVAADVAYDGTAIAEETREIVFSAGELGLAAAAGVPQTVRGRLAIDGALTIIAADTTRDLTGSSVKLTVTVEQATESSTETVFTGAVELAGRPDADVAVLAEGSFPTSRLILSNLAGLGADFGVFHVVIIPNITIDYNYTATVGTPLKLTARVRIDAANIPDNVGVAAVLGTPIGTLSQVLSMTNGSSTAAKVIDAIQRERDDPTGSAAIPNGGSPLLGTCGLFGFESLAGLVVLMGMRTARRGRRASV